MRVYRLSFDLLPPWKFPLTSMENFMEVGGSRLLPRKFPRKLKEADLLAWELVEAFMELLVHGNFRSQWKWKLPLLPSMAASTRIFCVKLT